MPRTQSPLWLALAVGALSAACAQDAATPTSSSILPLLADRQRDDRRPVTYAVIGDVPYTPFATPADRFPTLVSAINADPAVERWRPGDERPEILDHRLVWQTGELPETTIEAPALFAHATRSAAR